MNPHLLEVAIFQQLEGFDVYLVSNEMGCEFLHPMALQPRQYIFAMLVRLLGQASYATSFPISTGCLCMFCSGSKDCEVHAMVLVGGIARSDCIYVCSSYCSRKFS